MLIAIKAIGETTYKQGTRVLSSLFKINLLIEELGDTPIGLPKEKKL